MGGHLLIQGAMCLVYPLAAYAYLSHSERVGCVAAASTQDHGQERHALLSPAQTRLCARSRGAERQDLPLAVCVHLHAERQLVHFDCAHHGS